MNILRLLCFSPWKHKVLTRLSHFSINSTNELKRNSLAQQLNQRINNAIPYVVKVQQFFLHQTHRSFYLLGTSEDWGRLNEVEHFNFNRNSFAKFEISIGFVALKQVRIWFQILIPGSVAPRSSSFLVTLLANWDSESRFKITLELISMLQIQWRSQNTGIPPWPLGLLNTSTKFLLSIRRKVGCMKSGRLWTYL